MREPNASASPVKRLMAPLSRIGSIPACVERADRFEQLRPQAPVSLAVPVVEEGQIIAHGRRDIVQATSPPQRNVERRTKPAAIGHFQHVAPRRLWREAAVHRRGDEAQGMSRLFHAWKARTASAASIKSL